VFGCLWITKLHQGFTPKMLAGGMIREQQAGFLEQRGGLFCIAGRQTLLRLLIKHLAVMHGAWLSHGQAAKDGLNSSR
jgi:hypothetical protein